MPNSRSTTPPAPQPGTRPIDPSLHPLETGSYRIATPAIETFHLLVTRCLRYRNMEH